MLEQLLSEAIRNTESPSIADVDPRALTPNARS
jgi:carbamoylphosphate synthase small subunit